MMVEVKLYIHHDLDLVCLYRSGSFSFAKLGRQILNAYANNNIYRIEVENGTENKKIRRVYRFYINLNENKDKKAIELLSKIQSGYRNNFIKTVFRMYIGGFIPLEYLKNEEEQQYFRSRNMISQEIQKAPPYVRGFSKRKNAFPKEEKSEQPEKVSLHELPAAKAQKADVITESSIPEEKNDDKSITELFDGIIGM